MKKVTEHNITVRNSQ